MATQVSNLSGAKLDYWVGKARSTRPRWKDGLVFSPDDDIYDPSDSWAIAGPIMQDRDISVWIDDGKFFAAVSIQVASSDIGAWIEGKHMQCGRGFLEAAMRCFVASHFGDEVPEL